MGNDQVLASFDPVEEENQAGFSLASFFLFWLRFIFEQLLTGLVWLVAIPVRVFVWIINRIRARRYNPERVVCPGCGFRGDSGTDGKTCRITHRKVLGTLRAMNEHSCFRCGALFYTKLFLEADKWMPPEAVSKAAAKIEQVRAAIANQEI